MKASVIVPAYNSKTTIGSCLGSLANQEFSGEYEVIVVDDGSGDNTAGEVKKFDVKLLEQLARFLIEGIADDMPGAAFRAALCRCGQSSNKPFCDNSHEKVNFQDYAAVGESGELLTEKGGKLSIKPLVDGPLLLSGDVTIRAGSGRIAWQGDNAALCRCGASKNKPFCDGSHKEVGFKSN